ncbi:nectin-3-like protein isoform X2 [Scleropages formosus]|uniref:nectin-3-like protein isoform X2 n=1 Tax=Scleropages formosus TaxID=113540 RepID=UPI00087867DC|nr:nectin-3-like protein isoform X2 [Scleropages formosus]
MAAAALVRSRRTVPVEELPKSAGVWRRARAASHGHIMALSVRPRATGSSPSPRAALLMFTYFLTGTMGSEVLVPERVSAVLGKNVTLGCRVEVGANLSLTQSSWERHLPSGTVTLAVYNPQFGTSIPSEYKQRLSFRSPSPYDATIVLTDVGFSDIGTYTCKVATFPLGNTQASTYVTVLVEPKVYVSAGSTPLLDGGNETVVATCTAERARPPAEVSWETELFGHSQVRQQVEPNGTTTTQVQYTWHPTRHAQGHNITCVVRHPALHTDFRIPYQLNVQFSPDITVVGYSSDWYVGQENAQLQCRANANPPAHLYTWTRLDSDLPGDVYIFNNTLVFSRPVRRNDSGVYRCEVENRIGSRSRDTRIRVQDMSEKQALSMVTVAGAVIGAVLALFLLIFFTVVILSSRKASHPVYTDKVIDLPPTHKPPPPYSERPVSVPQATNPGQARRVERQTKMTENTSAKSAQCEARGPIRQPLSYHEWICHHNGADRIYVNHREHYV